MRVALITNFCPFYRVKVFRILAHALNCTFIFFSDASEKNWEALNPHGCAELPAVHLRQGGCGTLRMLWRLARTLRRGAFDVYVQGISGRVVVPLTWLLARVHGVPLIVWTGFWHHPRTLFHRMTFPLVRHIYRHADALVVYGSHVRDYLLTLGVDPRRIFIAWNTADNELYNRPVSADELAALRARHASAGEKVVLFVGRLDDEKGVDVLLDAVAALRGDTAVPPLRVLVCGRGPRAAALHAHAERLQLAHVTFLAYVPNDQLYQYYALADVLAVPSVTTRAFKEPWGLIVNEAMNQGCVVIASDAVGAARGGLLQHEHNGLVVPERNAPALADALRRVVSDDGLRAQLGAAARATIAAWTYQRMAQGFIDAVTFVASHEAT